MAWYFAAQESDRTWIVGTAFKQASDNVFYKLRGSAAEDGGPNPVEKAIQQFIDAQPEEVADEDKGPIVYGLCAAVGAFIFVIFAFLLRLPAALGFIVAGGFTGYSCYVASGLLPSVDSGFVAPESYSRQELSEDDQATPEKFKEDEPWMDKK